MNYYFKIFYREYELELISVEIRWGTGSIGINLYHFIEKGTLQLLPILGNEILALGFDFSINL
jgi:hypothetical protein